jgi:hypothetical protein
MVITFKFPKNTSVGGRRVEAAFHNQYRVVKKKEIGKEVNYEVDLIANNDPLRVCNEVIMRGYPKLSDAKGAAVFVQNFLIASPYQGLHILSLKGIVLLTHWLFFGKKISYLVFQSVSAKDRFLLSSVGKYFNRIFNFKSLIWSAFNPILLQNNDKKDIDLLIVTSDMPYKNNKACNEIIDMVIRLKKDASIYVTLDETNLDLSYNKNINCIGFIEEKTLIKMYGRTKLVFIPSKLESFSVPLHDCIHNKIPVMIYPEIQPDLASQHLLITNDKKLQYSFISKYLRG